MDSAAGASADESLRGAGRGHFSGAPPVKLVRCKFQMQAPIASQGPLQCLMQAGHDTPHEVAPTCPHCHLATTLGDPRNTRVEPARVLVAVAR